MARYHARKKFDILNELNKLSDEGGDVGVNARASKKARTQQWVKRTMSAGSMYKSKNAKPSEVSYV